MEKTAQQVALQEQLELVEVTLEKESRGLCLTVYLDKEGGLSLDDCEHYHKAIQPLLDDVEYDFLEVSSPGVDRPIKTQRDFEKNEGALVEVRLYAPVNGVKSAQGALTAFDEEKVTIVTEDGLERAFPRKSVALVKPVILFEDDEEEQE
ncbi:MAG: ribosome maturation factor RimP [Eubacteriales bacterium]|nr:ribosome maturation factor RimP [Eubacteriales bacterium]